MLEGNIYAVKKIRLHLSTEGDIQTQLKNHKTYREVLATAKTSNKDINSSVRYYSSWFEGLSSEEHNEEMELF
jgi:uncharacterized protein involved in tellurium resistance